MFLPNSYAPSKKDKKNDRLSLGSPELFPGIENPSVPPDDRPGAGMSLGEMFKDKIGEVTTGMDDHEPTTAAGDDDFLKKDATKKDKARDDSTRVTTLSYDEVDPS